MNELMSPSHLILLDVALPLDSAFIIILLTKWECDLSIYMSPAPTHLNLPVKELCLWVSDETGRTCHRACT
jgi:hypothetical protein